MNKPLTRHAEDNRRCLAAVLIVLAGSVGAYAVQRVSYPAAPNWIPIGVYAVLLTLATLLFSVRRGPSPERVTFDQTRVTRTLPNGRSDSVRWADLREIVIVSTDQGPGDEDLFWVLVGDKGGCGISGSAEGVKRLQRRLHRLPRFSKTTVSRAVGTSRNGSYVCWRREED